MKKYALLNGGKVAEVIEPLANADGVEILIEQRFHPDLVAQMIEIVDGQDVAVGDVFDGGAFSKPVKVEKSIDELKLDKNAEINEARLKANATSFEYLGKQIACDKLSKDDIIGTAAHIGLFGTFPPDFPGGWKTVDNTIISMPTIEDFKPMYQAYTSLGAKNFNKAQTLKAQLNDPATDTAEKVAAINW